MRTIDNGEPSDGTMEENGIPSEIFIEVDDEGGGNEIKKAPQRARQHGWIQFLASPSEATATFQSLHLLLLSIQKVNYKTYP